MIKRKKILFLTAFAPGNSGAGQHYTARLLNELSEDYDVDLIYFRYAFHERYFPDSPQIKILKEIPLGTLKKLLSALKIPFLHPAFTNRFQFSLAGYIRKISANYDLLYLDFYQTFIYGRGITTPKVLMVHDVLTQKYLRRSKNLFGRLWAYYCKISESFLMKKVRGNLICFSEKDRELIRYYFSLTSLKVDFLLDERIKNINPVSEHQLNGLCFYGAWSRSENSWGLEWFIDCVLPLCGSETKFYILGSGMPVKLHKKCKANPHIILLGFRDDPYPVLASCKGLIAPLFEGAGVKVKVLEALACGLPVIGTEMAFEGIDILPPGAAWVCSTPESFIEAIECVLKKSVSEKKYIKEYFAERYPSVTFKNLLKKIK